MQAQYNDSSKQYPRRARSQEWLKEYQKIQSKKKQIIAIKHKIYSDTVYRNLNKTIILDNNFRDPEKHICNTVFVLSFKKHHYLLNSLKRDELFDVLSLFNERNIKKIELLDTEIAMAYWGSQGLCGVIELTCRRKIYRKIKSIL